jgi:arylformamidase
MIALWFDISMPIDSSMPTYPSDPQFLAKPHKLGGINSRVTLHQLELGTHTGTHVDAPLHLFPAGIPISNISLDTFIGPCYVLSLDKFSLDLLPKLPQNARRVLFKANGELPLKPNWLEVYQGMPPEFASELVKRELLLVGIDALSIEERERPILETHQLLLEKNIIILEGLNLTSIDDGWYFLSALPLSLTGLDGSPVRAILKKN